MCYNCTTEGSTPRSPRAKHEASEGSADLPKSALRIAPFESRKSNMKSGAVRVRRFGPIWHAELATHSLVYQSVVSDNP